MRFARGWVYAKHINLLRGLSDQMRDFCEEKSRGWPPHGPAVTMYRWAGKWLVFFRSKSPQFRSKPTDDVSCIGERCGAPRVTASNKQSGGDENDLLSHS